MTSAAGNGLTVTFSLEIEATPAQVWAFLGSGPGLLAWAGHSDSIELEPFVGGRYDERGRFGDSPYRLVGTVLTYDPKRELAFSLRLVDDAGDGWPVDTQVRIRLQPSPKGTLVTLVHSGFERLPGERAHRASEGFRSGWDGGLERLRDAAARSG